MRILILGSALFFLAGSFSPTLNARPTFVYASALHWLKDTVHSEVPEGDRIYILGPDRTKEFYGLNNGIATHDLETRLVVSAHEYKTLTSLLSDLPFKDRPVNVLIWRANQKGEIDRPVYDGNMGSALLAPFGLQPDDVVELRDIPVSGAVTI